MNSFIAALAKADPLTASSGCPFIRLSLRAFTHLRLLPFLATTAVCGAATAGEAPKPDLYTGRDTLSIRPDKLPRAQARIEAVAWTPQAFEVRCTAANGGGHDAVGRT